MILGILYWLLTRKIYDQLDWENQRVNHQIMHYSETQITTRNKVLYRDQHSNYQIFINSSWPEIVGDVIIGNHDPCWSDEESVIKRTNPAKVSSLWGQGKRETWLLIHKWDFILEHALVSTFQLHVTSSNRSLVSNWRGVRVGRGIIHWVLNFAPLALGKFSVIKNLVHYKQHLRHL